MKSIIFVLFLIIGCVLLYLAFLPKINRFLQEWSKKMNEGTESFLTGQTGIDKICNLATDLKNYNNPEVCFDISYNDSTTGLPVQVRAQIQPGYYIDASGYLDVVPYGYIASSDKFSYVPKTNAAGWKNSSIVGTNAKIDEQIAKLQQQLASTPASDTFVLNGLQQKIINLQQQKLTIMDSNKTSNSNYNTNNYDITYHADPTQQEHPDESYAGAGKMWVNIGGSLVAVPYSDVSNTTLYHSAGSYNYNSPSYVPNYEESVFLSKLTNEPTTSETHNLALDKFGFCESTSGSKIDREVKCNAIDKNVCASTECCVLLGGEKCVAGNQNGPSIKSNYSDTTVLNRDYYYYRGNCFGNCV